MNEKINIKNYEAWWVDYLDGKLSVSDEERLFAFLELNPKISQNLIDANDFTIPSIEVKFSQKESLKSENQLEYLLIAKVENVISEEDDLFITEKIKNESEIAENYKLYQNAFAKPDNNIVFEGKKYLKKKEVIPLYKYSAIAAVFAFVFVVGYLLTSNVPEYDQGQPAQISFFKMPNIVFDSINQKDEFYNNQIDNSEKTIYASTEKNEEPEMNSEFNNMIEVPKRLPLSKIENVGNYYSNNEKQLLAYQANQPQPEDVAFEYELQYVKSPNEKDNKFKSTLSKVYDFGKEIDIAGSFDRLKMAKEDLFITMNE
ncbi:MAG: hypothetical protein PHW83_07120 [Bacteroidales bacterium]|nr:hypothetical protein [Bacteroidales bacterium]